MISCWWRVDDDDIIVYSEIPKSKIKFKKEPMGEYFKGISEKPYARQWKVKFGSQEQEVLFQQLGISDKDEIKAPRKKKGDLDS